VGSDIPTLLLTGRWDPVTPPAFAEQAAQTLPNSFVFSFPATGHVTLISPDACPYTIAWAFLRDPATRPDDSCIERMSGPNWVTRR